MNSSKRSKPDKQPDWGKIRRTAKRKFAVAEFREGQQELIDAVLSKDDALGVLPTGAGKSLCFQLPSLFLPGPTLVVSPLIALMQDQKEKLDEAGIEAARIDSTVSNSEVEAIEESIEEGDPNLIYVTPERLENAEFVDLLKTQNISLFVVDEAHCVSQWGHDFRPAYLNLRHVTQQLGRPPILALTATATDEVADDIIKQLGMKDPVTVRTGIDRPNLHFNVHFTVNEQAKHERLLEVLGSSPGSGIVYTATIKAAEQLTDWLNQEGIKAAVYHGKLRAAQREAIQHAFMHNEYKVIVATKAFGLGVDKPDVRFVVHYHFPDSPESYYQEAGRAGRDGEPAEAILLYQLEDKRIQSYFLGGKYPSRDDSWRVYDALSHSTEGHTQQSLSDETGIPKNKIKVLISYLEAAGVVQRKKRLKKIRDFESTEQLNEFLQEYERRHASDRDRLDDMMHYAQTLRCRVRFLKEYFGEDDEKNCGRCDNCNRSAGELLFGAA